MLRVRMVALGAVTIAACGGGDGVKPADAPIAPSSSGLGATRYFPLEEGRIYHYVTREGNDTGMLVAKVHRVDAAHGELVLSNGTKRLSYVPDGVRYDDGAYLLKEPLDVGASWPGEHGGATTIVATDAAVEVPAGRYSSCVRTVEQDGRTPGVRYETTYCPGIGMVLLVVSAGGHEARAELKSYGPPVRF